MISDDPNTIYNKDHDLEGRTSIEPALQEAASTEDNGVHNIHSGTTIKLPDSNDFRVGYSIFQNYIRKETRILYDKL